MADVNVRLNISAQGDAARNLRSAAEEARGAEAALKNLAAQQARVGNPPGNPAAGLRGAADMARQASASYQSGGSAGGGGGGMGAAEQALTGAARQMSASTQQLAQSQRQSAGETRTAMQAQRQTAVEAAQGRAAGQGAEGGLLSGALGKGLLGFGALRGLQSGLSGAAHVIGAASDPTIDPTRRGEAMREAIPLIGGVLKSLREFGEAISGTTAKVAGMRQAFDREMQEIQVRGQNRLGVQGVEAQRDDLRARAGAFGRQGFFGMGRGVLPAVPQLGDFDRTSVQGERAFEEARQRLPAEMGERGARLERGAARQQVADAERAVREKQHEFERAKSLAEQAGNLVERGPQGKGWTPITAPGPGNPLNALSPGGGLALGAGSGDKVGKEAALGNQLKAINELEQRRNELAAARDRLQQNAVGLAQAESGHRKALIALDQQHLGVLQAQEQRIKSSSQSWADMSAAEKMATEGAAERLKREGLAALSGEERGLLGRVAPDYLAKEKEKVAQADPAYKRILGGFGEETDLAKVRKQQVALENKIQIDIATDPAALATELKDKLEPMMQKAIDLMTVMMERKIQQIMAGVAMRNLQKQ